MATREESRRFFDAIARRYDRVYGLERDASRARMGRILELLGPEPREVLDLGIGPGRELPALLDAGHGVVGLDLSPEMVALCHRRARTVPITLGDMYAPLPFDAGAFDAVLALHGTLSHPPGEDALGRLAAELRRVLRPGGLLVAEVPSPGWVASLGEGDAAGDRALRRVGPGAAWYEDRVVSAGITVQVLEEPAWRAALGDHLDVAFERVDQDEVRIVARRR